MSETIETRRFKEASEELLQALARSCSTHPEVNKAFLLEARKPGSTDIFYIVAILLAREDEIVLDRVAMGVQEAMKGFPEIALRAHMMSAARKNFNQDVPPFFSR